MRRQRQQWNTTLCQRYCCFFSLCNLLSHTYSLQIGTKFEWKHTPWLTLHQLTFITDPIYLVRFCVHWLMMSQWALNRWDNDGSSDVYPSSLQTQWNISEWQRQEKTVKNTWQDICTQYQPFKASLCCDIWGWAVWDKRNLGPNSHNVTTAVTHIYKTTNQNMTGSDAE